MKTCKTLPMKGAKYKWQLYDLYDKAFPEQEKKASAGNGKTW